MGFPAAGVVSRGNYVLADDAAATPRFLFGQESAITDVTSGIQPFSLLAFWRLRLTTRSRVTARATFR